MTTKIVLDGRMKGQSSEALDRLAEYLYENPGTKLMGITEFGVSFCGEPGPDVQGDRLVRLRLVGCEVGAGDQEHTLRTAQRALWLQRSATGTLTEEGDLQYSQAVLDSLDDHIDASEAVRLRVAMDWLTGKVSELARNNRHDDGHLRREMKKVADVARRALAGEQLSLDDATAAKAAFIAAEARVAEAEEKEHADVGGDRLEETTGEPEPAGT